MPDIRQYQPIVGPVWREPVADRLSWLPEGQPYLPRQLESRAGYTVSGFPYDPRVLDWLPRGEPRQREPERRDAWIRLDPFPIVPPVYDPAGLQWLGMGQPPTKAPERRVAAIVLDPFPRPPVAYDPSGLQWVLMGLPPVVIERRVLGDIKLDPFPLPAPPPPAGPAVPEYVPTAYMRQRVEEEIRLAPEAILRGILRLPGTTLHLGVRQSRVRRRQPEVTRLRTVEPPRIVPAAPVTAPVAFPPVPVPSAPGVQPTSIARGGFLVAATPLALQGQAVAWATIPQAELDRLRQVPAWLLGAWWWLES